MLSEHFKSLLQGQSEGFFFVRAALGEHTTEESLHEIYQYARSVYDKLVITHSPFTPVFIFTWQEVPDYPTTIKMAFNRKLAENQLEEVHAITLYPRQATYGFTLHLKDGR